MSARDLVAVPGQTIGPFFGFALPFERGWELVPPTHEGALRLSGRVLDGAGQPVPDALVELWQPDADGVVSREPGSLRRGRRAEGSEPAFTGWGRAETDPEGHFFFTTVAPGAVTPGTAAYFAVTVFARGLLNRLFTRAYLPGDDAVLAADPVLAGLEPERRATLVARAVEDGFVFDIRLQGEDETVFLTYPRHEV